LGRGIFLGWFGLYIGLGHGSDNVKKIRRFPAGSSRPDGAAGSSRPFAALHLAPTTIRCNTRESFDRIGLLQQLEADVSASETAELAERLDGWKG
jgi:hypothetical protein